MTLDRIRTVVMDAARVQAAQIAAEAQAAAAKLAADARAEGERLKADAARETKLRTDRDLARELGKVRQEGRMAILTAKNDRMNEIFAAAREKFLKLPEKDYLGIVASWLGQLPAESGGTLRVNPKDVAKFQAKLADLNQGRTGAGKFAGVEADAAVACGALVQGPDFAADCTLDRRLEQLRETIAADLAKTLF